jgi:hypothetical protein
MIEINPTAAGLPPCTSREPMTTEINIESDQPPEPVGQGRDDRQDQWAKSVTGKDPWPVERAS